MFVKIFGYTVLERLINAAWAVVFAFAIIGVTFYIAAITGVGPRRWLLDAGNLTMFLIAIGLLGFFLRLPPRTKRKDN